jgi:hypothetical protein
MFNARLHYIAFKSMMFIADGGLEELDGKCFEVARNVRQVTRF